MTKPHTAAATYGYNNRSNRYAYCCLPCHLMRLQLETRWDRLPACCFSCMPHLHILATGGMRQGRAGQVRVRSAAQIAISSTACCDNVAATYFPTDLTQHTNIWADISFSLRWVSFRFVFFSLSGIMSCGHTSFFCTVLLPRCRCCCWCLWLFPLSNILAYMPNFTASPLPLPLPCPALPFSRCLYHSAFLWFYEPHSKWNFCLVPAWRTGNWFLSDGQHKLKKKTIIIKQTKYAIKTTDKLQIVWLLILFCDGRGKRWKTREKRARFVIFVEQHFCAMLDEICRKKAKRAR